MMFSGCALTRVSDASHAEDVRELNAVGLTMDEARVKAEHDGFECDDYVDTDVRVQIGNVIRRSTVLQCGKKSLELFCPQRRYVVFNIDPKTNKVYAVGKRINQNACF
jgi:hypothetical protein